MVSFELSLEPKKRKLYNNSSGVTNFRASGTHSFSLRTPTYSSVIWQLLVAKTYVEIFMHQYCKGKAQITAREHGEKSSRVSKISETWIFLTHIFFPQYKKILF